MIFADISTQLSFSFPFSSPTSNLEMRDFLRQWHWFTDFNVFKQRLVSKRPNVLLWGTFGIQSQILDFSFVRHTRIHGPVLPLTYAGMHFLHQNNSQYTDKLQQLFRFKPVDEFMKFSEFFRDTCRAITMYVLISCG